MSKPDPQISNLVLSLRIIYPVFRRNRTNRPGTILKWILKYISLKAKHLFSLHPIYWCKNLIEVSIGVLYRHIFWLSTLYTNSSGSEISRNFKFSTYGHGTSVDPVRPFQSTSCYFWTKITWDTEYWEYNITGYIISCGFT